MAYTNIDLPAEYFNTILYTGDDSASRSITGVGFQPDWIWVKSRSGAFYHGLWDVVRTNKSALYSNATDAEDTTTGGTLVSFNSDGFTTPNVSSGFINKNAGNYVAWNWKANGTGVSNTAGTISSTVSANTTAGFSIVSYTGNATLSQTIGHGLGVAPRMIIFKTRSGASDWGVYHESITNTKRILLNSTGASGNFTWGGSPTSSVFYVNNDGLVNGSGSTYIAYCFAEVKGYSKAFSYTGNGSTDGTFVYCGFRPAWILIKKSDGAVQNWVMHDSKRSPFNLSQNKLFANLSDAEDTGGTYYNLDILSNGFKLRSSNSDVNSSGGAYIGLAFAENPFVTSKGIPTTAR